MNHIAILGATGQIAKGLIAEFNRRNKLFLFARNPKEVQDFLDRQQLSTSAISTHAFEAFDAFKYDLVINSVGPGDPQSIRRYGTEIFRITERFDHLVLDYLERKPDTGYVFFSTGAIYGNSHDMPAQPDSCFHLPVNRLGAEQHAYPLAKIEAEARHRALSEYRIADIRIFGYFSRYMDPDGGFLLAELARCLLKGEVFRTDERDFLRDYVGPDDVSGLINCWLTTGAPNNAYDIYSLAPVTKAEIIDVLAAKFGLRHKVGDSEGISIKRISKPERISCYNTAQEVGYKPKNTSIDTIIREMSAMIECHN